MDRAGLVSQLSSSAIAKLLGVSNSVPTIEVLLAGAHAILSREAGLRLKITWRPLDNISFCTAVAIFVVYIVAKLG